MTDLVETTKDVELVGYELEMELITKNENLELLQTENTTLTLKVRVLQNDIIALLTCLENGKKIIEGLKKANNKALKDIEGLQGDIKALKEKMQNDEENTRKQLIKLKIGIFEMLENAIQRGFLTKEEKLLLKELSDVNN